MKDKVERIILHFGMDKAGSTSIRASLARKLADPHFHYVAPGMENSSRAVSAAFRENPAKFHYYRKIGLKESEYADVRANAIKLLTSELDKAKGKTAIISAEAVGSFNRKELTSLYEFLSICSDDVQVVGYVREPKEYMESNFQQKVKSEPIKTLVPDRLLSNYQDRFSKFDEVFGGQNVRLWMFDFSKLYKRCVVMDFCNRLNINFPESSVIRLNESLSLPATSLLYAYKKYANDNKKGVSSYNKDIVLARFIRQLKGPKLHFHSSLVEPTIRKQNEAIEWLEKRMGTSIRKDITANDDSSIRSEQALLTFSNDTLDWLYEQLDTETQKSLNRQTTDPEHVARYIELLRDKLSSGL